MKITDLVYPEDIKFGLWAFIIRLNLFRVLPYQMRRKISSVVTMNLINIRFYISGGSLPYQVALFEKMYNDVNKGFSRFTMSSQRS